MNTIKELVCEYLYLEEKDKDEKEFEAIFQSLFIEDMDHAIIGIGMMFGSYERVVYDQSKLGDLGNLDDLSNKDILLWEDMKLEDIAEKYPDFMTMDGYDYAVIGIVKESKSIKAAIAYDYDSVLDVSVKMGMTYEEAVEFFDYNQIGAYVGPHTPIFINVMVDKFDKEQV